MNEEIRYLIAVGSGSCSLKHLVPEGRKKSLCNHITAPTNKDGSVNQRQTYPFKGFDQKPDHMWCVKCRARVEDNSRKSED